MKKKVLIVIIVLTIIGGALIGGYAYSSKIAYDKQVKLERNIRAKKAYQKLEKQANVAINQAYISRSNADIDIANHAINKLNKNDQKSLKEKMNHLLELIEIIEKTNDSIKHAKKTKSEADITITQQLIDSINDDYLAKDKAQFQTSIDELKKSISEEKARAETARIKAEQEAETSALAEQQASYTDNQNNFQAQVIQETSSVSSNTDSSATSGGSYGVIPGTNNGVGWASSPEDVPQGAVIQP
ncbi:hypothetical protein [Enterococcus faecalis]|uniref:hypothetical protein n=1 Tax=Enterococcus faecalis TaxID=1351 RepID=UPI002938416D|nr:hypothetical protein [Enterococcus faecalis]